MGGWKPQTNTNKGAVKKEKKKAKEIEITQEDIDLVLNQDRDDPIVYAFAGRMDTCKSAVLAELGMSLPDGKICVVLDLDHSLKKVLTTHHDGWREKFIIIDTTAYGDDYKKGHLVALRALRTLITTRGKDIGLLAVEGMDRLLQRSFKMTCQARGYSLEDIKFFGHGGETEFTPTDWMIRNDYNVDPVDILFNSAAEVGCNLILTTHTEDKINQKRDVIEENVPIWYKTIPDYIDYYFLMEKVDSLDTVVRSARCLKARMRPEMYGEVREVMVQKKKEKETVWGGMREWMVEKEVWV